MKSGLQLRFAQVAWFVGCVVFLHAEQPAPPAPPRPPTPPKIYKGLEVSVAAVTRATNVSLSDCPPGANTQRGVIKPGDTTEFASVTVDFKATPAFKPGPIPKPVLADESGKFYNTAQSFTDVGASPSFSCTFSFRVPKGAKVTKFAIDTASFDITGLAK